MALKAVVVENTLTPFIKRFRPTVRREITQAINRGAALLHETAINSLMEQGAGTLYQRVEKNGVMIVRVASSGALVAMYRASSGRNLSEFHRASAPGQPPASDTGELASKTVIDAASDGDDPVARVVSSSPHAGYQEHGTKGMAARPFLQPAIEKHREEIVGDMRLTVRRSIKES